MRVETAVTAVLSVLQNFLATILQGAFLFVYVSVLTSESGKFKKGYLYHGVLFLAISIYCIFDFYILGADEKLNYYLTLSDWRNNEF